MIFSRGGFLCVCVCVQNQVFHACSQGVQPDYRLNFCSKHTVLRVLQKCCHSNGPFRPHRNNLCCCLLPSPCDSSQSVSPAEHFSVANHIFHSLIYFFNAFYVLFIFGEFYLFFLTAVTDSHISSHVHTQHSHKPPTEPENTAMVHVFNLITLC